MSTNKQVYKNESVQVRMDKGIHKRVRIRAAESGKSIKSLVEGFVVDGLGPVAKD